MSEYELADHLAHEFRTPLTVIKEYVAILHEGLAGSVSPQQREFLEIVDDRADDLALLVNDMLDLSRSEASLLRVWRRRSRLEEILAHVRPALLLKAAVKKASLSVSPEGNLPEVFCDPEAMGRLIVNLAVHAIRTCGDNGSVAVWCRRGDDGSDVVVGVTDSGPLVEPADLQAVRQWLGGAQDPDRASPRGFGLGMDIARQLVELHDGRMDVASEVGRGTTFSFTVPVWDPVELAARWLRRRGQQPPRPVCVALLLVETPATLDASAAVVVDEFLQHVFAASDLIVPANSHKWLILAECRQEDVDRTLDHVRAAWTEGNQGQPCGALPDILLRALGTWHGEGQAEAILARFCAELPAPGQRSGKPRILVVDDDRAVLRAMEIRLAAAGYDLLVASDGEQAIRLAAAERPDAILMDNCMPGLTGVDTLVRLGQQPETMDIPVIILSASARDKARAIEHGAHHFLQKPCDIQHLVAAIRRVTGAGVSG